MRWPTLKIAWRLLQKKLGFRMLMDVIPLRPELVKGTHGRKPVAAAQGPLLIATRRELAAERLSYSGYQGTDSATLAMTDPVEDGS